MGQLIKPIDIVSIDKPEKKKVLKEMNSLFEELFMCHDIENAVLCVSDIHESRNLDDSSVRFNYLLFSSGVRAATDNMKDQSVGLVTKLLLKLSSTKPPQITPAIMTRGLMVLLEEINEFSTDYPKVWEYGGQILGVMAFEKLLSLTHFREVKELHRMAKLVFYALSNIKKKHGEKILRLMFTDSGIKLQSLLRPGRNSKDDVESALSRYDLKELM
jgi:hypothetical protein